MFERVSVLAGLEEAFGVSLVLVPEFVRAPILIDEVTRPQARDGSSFKHRVGEMVVEHFGQR